MIELQPVEATLQDCRGGDHLYEITPFGYDEGFNLGLELADLIGGPLGDALKSMMVGGDVDLDALDDRALGAGLAELATLPRRILAAGGAQLVARLLAGTMRVDKDAQGNHVKQYLKDPAARTAAYAGGNQAESLHALRAVLEANYGPFLERLSEIVSPYLSGLGASLQSFAQRSQGKAPTSAESGEPTAPKQSSGGKP